MSVIDEIAAERKRQIDVEGWTPEHDDDIDFDFNHFIKCPYCGAENGTDCDDYSPDEFERECGVCENKIVVTLHHEVTWSTAKLKQTSDKRSAE